MLTRLVIAIVALAALAGAAAQADMAAVSRASVNAKSSAYGRILFDNRGFVLYGFTRDAHGKSRCTGACAKAWPPYIVKSRPRPGKGVVGARLGTVRRAGGRLQVTYFGRPLYYYVGDKKPGQILWARTCPSSAAYGESFARPGASSGRGVGKRERDPGCDRRDADDPATLARASAAQKRRNLRPASALRR